MQWFRNRKTAVKLMLGFGVMAVLMLILGVDGIRNLREVDDTTRVLYEHHALGLNHLKQAHMQLVIASRSLRNALLAKDVAERQGFLDQNKNDRAVYVSEFDQFYKMIVSEEVRNKANAAMQVQQEVEAGQNKLADLIRADQRDRALVELHGLNAVAAQLDNAMHDLELAKLATMKKGADKVTDTAHSAQITSMVVVGVSMTLAICLGMIIARIITGPLSQMVSIAGKVAVGELDQKVDYRADDETGQLAVAFTGLITLLKGLISETGGTLAKIAQKDLTVRMRGDYQGDFVAIKQSVNATAETLGSTMLEVKGAAEHVSDTAQQLSSASEEIASGAQEQASSLEETASSLEQISSTIKQNAENARQASQLAAGSREAAEKGGQVVNAAVEAMGEINQSSKRIADIITTIDEIAFQTNLLALNAAVEAARAGEQGRGFAVVASEVRNLAQRSATAAKEIKGLIQDSVHKVENGSELVNRSGQTLSEIVQSVKRVTDIVAEIAAASQEQATGIEQVNKATMQMDQVTQANSAQTEEMSSTAQGLSSSAEQLQALVASFQLTGSQRAVERKTPVSRTPYKSTPRTQSSSLVSLAKASATDSAFEEF